MNTHTKQQLDEFILAVQHMAEGCVQQIGGDGVIEVIVSGENLKKALECDETIKESK